MPIDGILGPGMSANDVDMEVPACVNLNDPSSSEQFKSFMDTVVRHTLSHAADTLKNMLAQTPGAEQLAKEFAARLGV